MIYDCFTFFNELDLLEIRLNTLNDVVDKFVLVESILTHQGKPKDLYYELNKERYSKFAHKIIHIISNQFPEGISDSWEYEHFQRNEIKRGLVHCKADDVIMVSDLDEIPAPEAIKSAASKKGLKIFKQKSYCYFLNCSVDESRQSWIGTAMISYSDLNQPQNLRNEVIRSGRLNRPQRIKRIFHLMVFYIRNFFLKIPVSLVAHGGWHFTYIGGAQKIIQKIESFAHTEFNKPEYKDKEKLDELLKFGVGLFDGKRMTFVPIDHSFPFYVRENQQRFSSIIRQPD